MAAFKIKKGQKVYQAKAFQSLVQLAQRGLIEPEDPVFVPNLNKWVYAGSIKELRAILGESPDPAPPSTGERASKIPQNSVGPVPHFEADALKARAAEGPKNTVDLNAKAGPKFRIHSHADEREKADELELPMVYVETLDESQLPEVISGKPGPKWVQHNEYDMAATQKATPELFASLRAESVERRQEPRRPEPKKPAGPPEIKGLNDLFAGSPELPTPTPHNLAAPGGVDLTLGGGLSGGLPSERPAGGPAIRPVSGVTVDERRRGVSLARVLIMLSLPAGALGLYYWMVTSTANSKFETSTQNPPAAVAPVVAGEASAVAATPVPEVTPDERTALKAEEKALRDKIPLKLRNPVRTPIQVQDDIIAEMLNAGAIPLSVELEPLAGEFPPRSSLRSLEVNVNMRIRESTLVDSVDQVVLAALIVGKYARSGGLKVTGMDIAVLGDEREALANYQLTGQEVRDFYGRNVDLAGFLEWL